MKLKPFPDVIQVSFPPPPKSLYNKSFLCYHTYHTISYLLSFYACELKADLICI